MNIFQKIASKRPPKNKFNLDHERKFSFSMGTLTPILVQDVVPGDKFRVKSEIFLRMAPMLAPIMHRVNVYTHYFFVPNRLVWNEWEDFITGGRDGNATPVSPYINTTDLNYKPTQTDVGSLWDYMGLPILSNPEDINTDISALPFRAYQMIYNEYYRDQNLSDPVEFGLGSGRIDNINELYDLLTIRQRAWEKDYFTSALPWAQRGGDVHIPIEGEADWTYKTNPTIRVAGTDPNIDRVMSREDDAYLRTSGAGQGIQPVTRIDNIESIEIDNAQTTINDLRRSIRLQEWLEKNARGGARYIEQILSHFGVKSSDARLQRPEYLGGGRQPVSISEVLSTFQDETIESNPLATMAGHGVSVGKNNGFTRFFEEHGYVIGLISVLPKTAYQQGIPRHFSRFDKFDYYWPEFANIGEQEIKNKELYTAPGSSSVDLEGTFGYTPRYSEYKYAPSTVHGEMRDSLSYWHMGRIFNTKPSLNESFVRSNPTTRIFAVEDQEHMYCQIYNSVSALRPMPYFGTPTL